MPDSPRYCDNCKSYGDHHTDRCPTTWGKLSVQEQSDLAMSEEIARQKQAAAARAAQAAARTKAPAAKRRVKRSPARQALTTNQLCALSLTMSAFVFLMSGHVALAFSIALCAYLIYSS